MLELALGGRCRCVGLGITPSALLILRGRFLGESLAGWMTRRVCRPRRLRCKELFLL